MTCRSRIAALVDEGLGVLLVALAMTLAACGTSSSVRIVDLVRDFRDAEARPSRAAFEVDRRLCRGQSEPAIRTIVPSRHHLRASRCRAAAHLSRASRSTAASTARLLNRFGFASASATTASTSSWPTSLLTPGDQTGWTELRADLSAYAGWQWSVFYRPEDQRWRLVLSADAVSGVRTRGVWGAPGIDGDRSAAREHVERAARMSR